MSIFKIVLIGLFGFNTIGDMYYAGAYANGKETSKKGNITAAIYFVSSLVDAVIVYGLYMDW
jgi:hypothetical protein